MAQFHCSYQRNEDMKKQLNEISRTSRSIKGFITRYILNTRTVLDGENVKRVAFGEKQKNKPHKTILIVGETGVGKSTLINSMVNYMLGVESEDRIWCEIIETKEKQSVSQTHAVTVYDVFTEHCPFSLTVIDTPGFGSTEGKKEDLSVAESLLELFKSTDGVHELDAVCLVVTSSTVRLTDRQHYIFNAVLSLFGRDVEKNIVLFITHAAKKPNNAIKAIKESKVPCALTAEGDPVYFRFDNSHCEDFDDDEISDDYQASWNQLNTTMENFQTFLQEIKPINLKITEAVLKKRKQLTASIFNIQDKIKLTELKQKELEQTKEALQEHEKGKRDSNNFECVVDEAYKQKVPLEYRWWHFGQKEATCCRVCEENCHYPGCWWVRNLSWCSVMNSSGKCTVCTGKCHYTKHVKEGKIYVVKTRRVKKTMEDLKKKYETKSGEMKSLMSGIENDMRELEKEQIRLVEECYDCVILMEEIALKSDSVFTLQHLDFLIEKVKETGNTDRVQKLQGMKKRMEENSAKAFSVFKSMQ
ncbi:hypothetical protein KOW79_000149 [Hemibagrus wyckioides]|uniref:AIG1-type G domain-containing protein n=1 Tax=Hemibagrus wyckioides TaxID=337641 RepID=A0A9D3P6F3_9TELE|nr:uncharacterized protein LOC131369169 [Hemibagrus wyckioides]XP_058271750.1 uncharacterized protein LOC131369169 [Hemibagrus wyckioides]KAG7335456.1 hypothetical protein KOW79_000149 [Hemibagrus wyckioides]